jgi:hypothetical protein
MNFGYKFGILNWFRVILELGMACERDIQCIQLAYCTHNVNETNPDIKICQCREEYTDEDGTCSGM